MFEILEVLTSILNFLAAISVIYIKKALNVSDSDVNKAVVTVT